MSTAVRKTDHCPVGTYTVVTGQSATVGYPARLITATTVQNATAGSDDAIGIFAETATAGNPVRVYLYAPIVAVTVGTGGATLGAWAKPVADGVADAPAHDSSGGTDDVICGKFVETGVATTRVGMMLLAQNRGSA